MGELQTVPLAAYESLSTRLCRIIRWIITGWAISVVAMGLIIVLSISYSDEVITETMTNEVEQEADDYGSNTFAGGDYYGSTATNPTNGQAYDDTAN